MAKITISTQTYELQPLVFATIKKIWPVVNSLNSIYAEVMQKTSCTVQEAQAALDPLYQMEQALKIVSYALEQDHSDFQNPLRPSDPNYIVDYAFEQLSKRIRPKEIEALDSVVRELLDESGFSIEPGNITNRGGKESSGEPSTETGTDSLQSSLPLELKEEAGTQSNTDGPSSDTT